MDGIEKYTTTKDNKKLSTNINPALQFINKKNKIGNFYAENHF